MKIGIIGAGNLGKALIERLRGNSNEILVSSTKKGNYNGVQIIDDNKFVAKNSDIIILTVKPSNMDQVLNEISSETPSKLVVSFAAGLRLNFYEKRIQAKVVRAMTNLGVENKKGFSVYKLSSFCGLDDKYKIEKIMSYLGKSCRVTDEKIIDIITGISGSGIAYFIKIIDIFVKTAKENGLENELAFKSVKETINGAISLLENNDFNSEELINKIASKGGTTESGLNEFEEKNLGGIIETVLQKTISKSKQLGDQYE